MDTKCLQGYVGFQRRVCVFTGVCTCLCVYSGVCERVGVDRCVNSAPAVERSTDAETKIGDYD